MLLLLKGLRASSLQVTYPDPDGAIVVGGDDVTHTRQMYAYPSGGVIVGGDGTYISAIIRATDGAILVGGDGLPVVWSIASGQGQDGAILVGGDAAPVQWSIASGGMNGAILVGGDSVACYREMYAYPSGGVVVGGDGISTPIFNVSMDPDGGIYLGGDGVSVQWSMASGAAASGNGVIGDGAIVLGGDGAYRFEFTPTGGIVVGGDGIGITIVTLNGQTVSIGTAKHRGPTTQIEIMRAMKNRLIETSVFTEPNVFIGQDPVDARVYMPTHEKFCCILVGDKDVDQGQLAGGGTDADFRTETFEIRVYTRLQTDRIGQLDYWATQGTKGAYAVARSAASKFQVHDLQDSSGTIIVGEPTRILRIGNPVPKKDGIGYVPIYVEVKYTEREP